MTRNPFAQGPLGKLPKSDICENRKKVALFHSIVIMFTAA